MNWFRENTNFLSRLVAAIIIGLIVESIGIQIYTFGLDLDTDWALASGRLLALNRLLTCLSIGLLLVLIKKMYRLQDDVNLCLSEILDKSNEQQKPINNNPDDLKPMNENED